MHRPVQEEVQPEDIAQSVRAIVQQTTSRKHTMARELTCNVDNNNPIASTATYCPASLAVSKGVMT